MHHGHADGEVPAVASAQASEAADHGGVWKHFLPHRDSVLRPDDIDVRRKRARQWMPGGLKSVRGSVLLSLG